MTQSPCSIDYLMFHTVPLLFSGSVQIHIILSMLQQKLLQSTNAFNLIKQMNNLAHNSVLKCFFSFENSQKYKIFPPNVATEKSTKVTPGKKEKKKKSHR